MSPVTVGSELVERNVTDESMSLVVERRGDVAGNAIAGRLDAGRSLPSASSIERIRRVGIVLIDGDHLLRVIGINGDAGLGKVSGLGSERDDGGIRGFGWKLRKEA